MTSVVTICNMALSRIGIDQTIEDLDDTSTRARACNLWYEHCRDRTLSDAPWNFSLRVVALAKKTGTAPIGWAYHFAYPADCLALRDVTDESGARRPLSAWVDSLYRTVDYLGAAKYPYEVRGSDDGRVIVCDLDEPYALYTSRVTNSEYFDVQFMDALAWSLAVEIGGSLRADPGLVKVAAQMAQVAMTSAKARFMREQRPDRQPDSVSISARN